MSILRPPEPRAFTPDDVWMAGVSESGQPLVTLLDKMSCVQPQIYDDWWLYNIYPDHQAMVNWFIDTGRVYYAPGKPEIIKSHGAEVLLYAQDMHPKSAEYRATKIDEALDFHGPVTNFKVLNALRALHPGFDGTENSGDLYTSGAALIWLSEVAALKAPKKMLSRNFLACCAKNGFSFGDNNTFDKQKLIKALHKTLAELGIDQLPEVKKFIKSWPKSGSFVANGQEQKSENGTSYGSYTILAGNIYALNTSHFSFNNLISFVRYNSHRIQNLRKFGIPLEVILPASKLDKETICEFIVEGKKIRHTELEKHAARKFKGKEIKPISETGKAYFKQLLSTMSYETLTMLATCNHSIAYAPREGTIESIYPGERGTAVLGSDATTCDISRNSPGLRVASSKTLFFSDGYAGLNMAPADLLIKHAMTLMHEAIHIVLDIPMFIDSVSITGGVPAHEYHTGSKGLVGGIIDYVVEAGKKLQTLSDADKEKYLNWSTLLDPSTNLGQIFNPKQPAGYTYGEKEWTEELFCNWVAISSHGGQYARGAVKYNIFHSTEGDENVPEQIKFSQKVTKAVGQLVKDLYEAAFLVCGDNTPWEEHGKTAVVAPSRPR